MRKSTLVGASLLILAILGSSYFAVQNSQNLQGRFRVPQVTAQVVCASGTFDSPAYDFFVDPDLANANADYHNLPTAFTAPSGSKIALCPGKYPIYGFIENKDLSFFGTGPNAADIIITPDRAGFKPGIDNGAIYISEGTLSLYHLTIDGLSSKPMLTSVDGIIKLADVVFQNSSRAIANLTGSELTIQDSQFTNNIIDINWGESSDTTILNTDFIGTSNIYGGAILPAGGLIIEDPRGAQHSYSSGDLSSLNIKGSAFSNYKNERTIHFYAYNSRHGIQIKNTDFTSNGDLGYTVYLLDLTGDSPIVFDNVQYTENSSHVYGAYLTGTSIEIKNSNFSNNTNDQNEVLLINGNAGAITLEESEITENHIFHPAPPSAGNPAVGAIEAFSSNRGVKVENTVFRNNAPVNCSNTITALINLGGNIDSDGTCL